MRGLRIFGHGEGHPPLAPAFEVQRNEEDPRQALLTWEESEGAVGYIIRHGISEDKLYNSNIIYHNNTCEVRSMDRGTDYYITVDAFNENGVGKGKHIQFIPTTEPDAGVRTIKAEYK